MRLNFVGPYVDNQIAFLIGFATALFAVFCIQGTLWIARRDSRRDARLADEHCPACGHEMVTRKYRQRQLWFTCLYCTCTWEVPLERPKDPRLKVAGSAYPLEADKTDLRTFEPGNIKS